MNQIYAKAFVGVFAMMLASSLIAMVGFAPASGHMGSVDSGVDIQGGSPPISQAEPRHSREALLRQMNHRSSRPGPAPANVIPSSVHQLLRQLESDSILNLGIVPNGFERKDFEDGSGAALTVKGAFRRVYNTVPKVFGSGRRSGGGSGGGGRPAFTDTSADVRAIVCTLNPHLPGCVRIIVTDPPPDGNGNPVQLPPSILMLLSGLVTLLAVRQKK